jgi:hypothetical protein
MVEEARLRGRVTVHQDPAEGKKRGTDVAGEAVDLFNRGEGKTRFVVFHRDGAAPSRGKAGAAAAEGNVEDSATFASIRTDEMTIVGHVIGLDQSSDMAWVDGPGRITQMTTRGLLSDRTPAPEGRKPAARDGAAAAAPDNRTPTPMHIWFGRGMRFYGRPADRQGRALAARAEFYQDVHAETEDASIDCRKVMYAYFDRPIKLTRPPSQTSASASARRDPQAAPEEPKPEIARVECFEDVVVINVKLDPESRAVLEKQRIEGERITYNKQTGQFHVPGEGAVCLWQRDGQSAGGFGARTRVGDAGTPRRTIIRTSGPAPDADATATAPAIGRNSTKTPDDLILERVPHGRGPSRSLVPQVIPDFVRPLPPLTLTQIYFTDGMTGRVGSGRESDKTERREANFYGDVEALHGQVEGPGAVFDFDRPPANSEFLTSQMLRVVSEPSADTRNPDAPPRNWLRAWDNAVARSDDKTIQADEITFDSQNDLFWAYGHEGRMVLIVQQNQIGQPATEVPARALRYNHKTREAKPIEPASIAVVDAKTGTRPKLADIPADPERKRPKRQKYRNLRSSIERKDFTGR